MRKKMAILKTVLALRTAYDNLNNRDPGVPGMMLITGASGAGKTQSVQWLCEDVNGIYVRASSLDTPVTLLSRILREIGQESRSYLGNGVDIESTANYMRSSRRALFVDEIDNLFHKKVYTTRLVEAVRDLHDMSETAVVMIGHSGVERRMATRQQLFRRISQWVNYLPADLEDTAMLASCICEVELEEDLLQHVHQETNGNPGLITVSLSRIEAFAKANALSKVSADMWGNQRLFVNPKARVA
jgi:DNA transposition AAA+ family ATPase